MTKAAPTQTLFTLSPCPGYLRDDSILSMRERVNAHTPVSLLTHHGSRNACTAETPIHQHSFHQIEYIQTGISWVYSSGTWEALPAGAAVLLSPGHEHGFRFGRRTTAFFSLKFHAEAIVDPPLRLDPLPGVVGLLDALAELLPLGESVSADRRLLCEQLIGCLLRCLKPSPVSVETGLTGEIARACADILPVRPTARTVADHLGLSRRGLHDRCQRVLSQSARATIDTWLLHQAELLLRYETDNLDQIAAALGFADAFAFSRFFRRVGDGLSPGRWRRANQEPAIEDGRP